MHLLAEYVLEFWAHFKFKIGRQDLDLFELVVVLLDALALPPSEEEDVQRQTQKGDHRHQNSQLRHFLLFR